MKTNTGTDKQRGIAAVEFALALPIFMMVLVGILEFGQAFYRQQLITTAVREAARTGVVATDPRPSETEIRTAALSFLDNAGLDSAQAAVSVAGAGGDSGDPLTVGVQYPSSFAFLSSFMAAADHGTSTIPGNINLSAQMVFELE